VVLGLRARGLDPLLVVVQHRGLEHVIPRGSRGWFGSGHRIDVRWSVYHPGADGEGEPFTGDSQAIADALRAEVVRLRNTSKAEDRDPA
jgi:hypothetical protein